MASYLGISHLFQMSNPCGEEGGCSQPSLGNGSVFGDPPNSTDMALPFHGFKHQLKEGILVVSIILPIFLLFLTCYAILLYCRRRRRRLMNSLANRETAGGGEDIDGDNNDVVGDGGLHHVWFIRTVGLDQTTIDSIKIFPYKFGDPLIGTTNCSVCLSEFREGEDVRLLPKCSHAFHISCIDTWLGSHVNCPLCRAPVVVASPPAPLAAAATTAGLGSSSSTTVRTTSEESNPGSSEDLQNPQLQTNVVATENSAHPIARECSSRSGSFSATAFRVLSDLGHLGGRRAVSNGVDAIVAPHRSFSMDFSAMGVATEGNAWQERKEASLGLLQVPSRVGVMEKQWSRRKGTCSLGMTRSASTNGGGGKILGSRFGRGRSNSFLPL